MVIARATPPAPHPAPSPRPLDRPQRVLAAGVAAATSRARDQPEAELRSELGQAAESLDHTARMAMAAMLQGPVFDSDARRPAGPVLSWVDKWVARALAEAFWGGGRLVGGGAWWGRCCWGW